MRQNTLLFWLFGIACWIAALAIVLTMILRTPSPGGERTERTKGRGNALKYLSSNFDNTAILYAQNARSSEGKVKDAVWFKWSTVGDVNHD